MQDEVKECFLPWEMIEHIKSFVAHSNIVCIEYTDLIDGGQYKEVVLAWDELNVQDVLELFQQHIGLPGLAKVIPKPRRLPRDIRRRGKTIPITKLVLIDDKPFIAEEVIGWPVFESMSALKEWLAQSMPLS